MNAFARRAGLALLLGLAFVPAPSQAMPISAIVAFGDSNVDNGNLAAAGAAVGAVINPPPNFGGRNSNGIVVVEYLAQMLGRPLQNYAFSGANTGTGFNFGLAKNTLSQITDYLTDRGGAADPNALYVYWAGSNDLLGVNASNIDARLAFAEANITAGLTALSNAGASRIVVANRTPRPDLNGANNGFGQQLNAMIAGLLPELDDDLAADLLIFDNYSLMADMVLNAAKYGFTRVGANDLCINDPVCSVNPVEAMKWTNWDAAHKTTRVHELTAMALISEFELPLPAAAWVFLFALGALGAVRLRERLAQA